MALPRTSKRTPALPAVYIELPTLDRADEFIAAARRSRRFHHPWLHAPDTSERFENLVERSSGPGRCSFLICRHADDTLVGAVNVSDIVRGSRQSASIGYCGFLTLRPFYNPRLKKPS